MIGHKFNSNKIRYCKIFLYRQRSFIALNFHNVQSSSASFNLHAISIEKSKLNIILHILFINFQALVCSTFFFKFLQTCAEHKVRSSTYIECFSNKFDLSKL